MGLRNKSTTGKKLTVNRETLRKLQLRTLSDDELRAAPGGWGTGTCGGRTECCAPSHNGC